MLHYFSGKGGGRRGLEKFCVYASSLAKKPSPACPPKRRFRFDATVFLIFCAGGFATTASSALEGLQY